MQKQIQSKLENAKKIIANSDSMLIAFSGGVDSTLLAKLAFDELKQNAIAVTADSPSLKRSELENAKKLAKQIGVKHIIIQTSEVENEAYKANPGNRCYYCKFELFDTTPIREYFFSKKLTFFCHSSGSTKITGQRG